MNGDGIAALQGAAHESGYGPSVASGDVRFCAAFDGRADTKARPTPMVCEYTPWSFRDDAERRIRNLEIPRCAIAHLRSGPSDRPGMTTQLQLHLPGLA